MSARVPSTLEENKGWIYVFGVNFASGDCRPRSRGTTELVKASNKTKHEKTKRFIKKWKKFKTKYKIK